MDVSCWIIEVLSVDGRLRDRRLLRLGLASGPCLASEEVSQTKIVSKMKRGGHL